LPDAKPPGITKLCPGQRRPRHPYDRKVCLRIPPDENRRHGSTVGKRHGDRSAAFDNVIVSQGETIGRENDPRTAAPLQFDAHDSRSGDFHGADDRARIRVEQRNVIDDVWLTCWVHNLILERAGRARITRIGGRRTFDLGNYAFDKPRA